MTTVEKIMQAIRAHKIASLIAILITTLIFLAPLLLYFYTFHYSLSSDPNKWSVFGSYFGGVYGPLATIISVIVLVITVIEINQSNRISITESKNNNHINDIVNLCEILDKRIDKNNLIPNRNYQFESLSDIIRRKITNDVSLNEYDIWKESIRKFDNSEFPLFENESKIMEEILIRINSSETLELKERAKSIFYGIIPNNERFWLECYMHRFKSPEREPLIPSWGTFSQVPTHLKYHVELNELNNEFAIESGDKNGGRNGE
ncbi:MAG: hypothetical protein E7J62_12870 [Serratia marcescens]|uniref:hypothetical protein n=1 Tax=Serratia marcescens TaxID=615 RepID=UPI0013DADFD2|nr:hypothetical protein [Serratia marcescens]MDU7805514.1 hypothetical protein [Serratia marcescens]BEO30092.1 hypothetical protein SMQC21_36720 [Serratia marcescens]